MQLWMEDTVCVHAMYDANTRLSTDLVQQVLHKKKLHTQEAS